MEVRTDDDVYRIDAVWLGPPQMTFPWRVRYVSYAVGFGVLVAVMAVQRGFGIGFGLWSTAWALVVTVAVVRALGRCVDDERPLAHVLGAWWADVRTPRPARTPRQDRAPHQDRMPSSGAAVRDAYTSHPAPPAFRRSYRRPTPEAGR